MDFTLQEQQQAIESHDAQQQQQVPASEFQDFIKEITALESIHKTINFQPTTIHQNNNQQAANNAKGTATKRYLLSLRVVVPASLNDTSNLLTISNHSFSNDHDGSLTKQVIQQKQNNTAAALATLLQQKNGISNAAAASSSSSSNNNKPQDALATLLASGAPLTLQQQYPATLAAPSHSAATLSLLTGLNSRKNQLKTAPRLLLTFTNLVDEFFECELTYEELATHVR